MTPTRHIASAAIAAAAAFFAPQAAQALCAEPNGPEPGMYENVDSDTRSITRMRVEFVCGSERTRNPDGTGTIRHGADPHWRIWLWGSCSPTDCEWGATRANMMERGAYLYGHYDQGFAERDVQVFPAGDDRLRLRIRSRYDDDRSARTSVNIMELR